jgi:HEAT repeat protein
MGSERLYHIHRSFESELTREEYEQRVREMQRSQPDEQTELVQRVLIDDTDPQNKKRAINILAKKGTNEAIERLTTIATDRDGTRADIRAQAAARLDEFEDPRVEEPLVDVIENDPYYAAVNDAIVCIGEIPAVGAFETLVEVLEDDENYMDKSRRSAAVSLGNLEDKRVVEPLIRRLDPDVEESVVVRRAAVEALSRLEDVRIVEPLVDCLNDPAEDVCGRSIEVLGEMGDRRAIEPLSGVLNSPDQYVSGLRSAAATALVNIGEMEAVNPLLRGLDDPSPEVRTRVIHGLGELGAISAVEELESILSNPDDTLEVERAT